MKVLSITNLCLGHSATLPERGLYKGLAKKGVDLTVITHWKTPESQELEDAGISVIYLPIKRKIDIRAIRLIRNLISSEKIEILHITFGKAITNGLIASFGTKCRIIAYLGSVSLHWHDPSAYLSFLNRRIDKLICLSKGIERHVLKQCPERMAGKAVQIYKGYEASWFSNIRPVQREKLNIPDNGLFICCVANVRRIKGIPYLIKSADFLPDNIPVYFILIGPGMDSKKISKLVEESKYANNFRIFGFINDVLSYTAACDLYVQPSITEGLGRSVIEAMCFSKPVVVSGTGGVEELVEEGITGYHIPWGSPEALADKILHCFENRQRWKEMGLKARERIETEFNASRMVEETYHLFNSTISRQ